MPIDRYSDVSVVGRDPHRLIQLPNAYDELIMVNADRHQSPRRADGYEQRALQLREHVDEPRRGPVAELLSSHAAIVTSPNST